MTVPLSHQEGPDQLNCSAPVFGPRCHLCGGQLDVLVRVEPQPNGQPVTYYVCEQCAHVLVRKS